MNEFSEKKLWFRRKTFGWGWQPSSWQGWGVITLYFLGVLSDALFDKAHTMQTLGQALQFFFRIIIMTTFLLIICYKTGEKPAWRWGMFSRKNKDDTSSTSNGTTENE